MKKTIELILNGEKRIMDVDVHKTLLETLRETFGIKSPKCGCDRGDCGTCTVMINGKTVRSCLVLGIEANGQEITTLEGLMNDGMTPLQETMLKNNAFQCGFCAPGMIMSAEEVMKKHENPTEEDIIEGIAGNLCRCTGYSPIIKSIKETIENNK